LRNRGHLPNPLHEKLLTLDEERVAKLYQNVFGDDEGQLVLQDLKNRCFVNFSTAFGTVADGKVFYSAEEQQNNEGMRTVFLHIQTQIDYEPPEKEIPE